MALKDLTGKTFGVLRVISRAENYRTNAQWLVKCTRCGREKIVVGSKLTNNHQIGCKCTMIEKKSKKNKFLICGDIVYGFDERGARFKFDLDKLDKVKKYYWSVTPRGYVKNTKHRINLHRYLTGASPKFVVDHINHDTRDNTLANLRVFTHTQNMMNSKRYKSNKSGYTGVTKNKYGKYEACISINSKYTRLGTFSTFEEAVKARKEAEIKYYGEFTNDKK